MSRSRRREVPLRMSQGEIIGLYGDSETALRCRAESELGSCRLGAGETVILSAKDIGEMAVRVCYYHGKIANSANSLRPVVATWVNLRTDGRPGKIRI